MLKWLLGLVDGPIISRACAAVAAGVGNFIVQNMHWSINPKFVPSLTITLTYLAYAAVHAGIVTGSQAAGNQVTPLPTAPPSPGAH